MSCFALCFGHNRPLSAVIETDVYRASSAQPLWSQGERPCGTQPQNCKQPTGSVAAAWAASSEDLPTTQHSTKLAAPDVLGDRLGNNVTTECMRLGTGSSEGRSGVPGAAAQTGQHASALPRPGTVLGPAPTRPAKTMLAPLLPRHFGTMSDPEDCLQEEPAEAWVPAPKQSAVAPVLLVDNETPNSQNELGDFCESMLLSMQIRLKVDAELSTFRALPSAGSNRYAVQLSVGQNANAGPFSTLVSVIPSGGGLAHPNSSALSRADRRFIGSLEPPAATTAGGRPQAPGNKGHTLSPAPSPGLDRGALPWPGLGRGLGLTPDVNASPIEPGLTGLHRTDSPVRGATLAHSSPPAAALRNRSSSQVHGSGSSLGRSRSRRGPLITMQAGDLLASRATHLTDGTTGGDGSGGGFGPGGGGGSGEGYDRKDSTPQLVSDEKSLGWRGSTAPSEGLREGMGGGRVAEPPMPLEPAVDVATGATVVTGGSQQAWQDLHGTYPCIGSGAGGGNGLGHVLRAIPEWVGSPLREPSRAGVSRAASCGSQISSQGSGDGGGDCATVGSRLDLRSGSGSGSRAGGSAGVSLTLAINAVRTSPVHAEADRNPGVGSTPSPPLAPHPQQVDDGAWPYPQPISKPQADLARPLQQQLLPPASSQRQQQQQRATSFKADSNSNDTAGADEVPTALRRASRFATAPRSASWYGGAPAVHPDPTRVTAEVPVELWLCRTIRELFGGVSELRPLDGVSSPATLEPPAHSLEPPPRPPPGLRRFAGADHVRPPQRQPHSWQSQKQRAELTQGPVDVGAPAASGSAGSGAGSGCRSVVLQGRWQGQPVALKLISGPPGLNTRGTSLASVLAAAAVVHPDLVRVYGMRLLPAAAAAAAAAAGPGKDRVPVKVCVANGCDCSSGGGSQGGVAGTAGREALAALALRPGEGVLAVIMELCSLGSLEPLTRAVYSPFRPSRSWPAYMARRALLRTATEVAEALAHLHRFDLTHGSLRPSNVLLVPALQDRRKFRVKVSDVGLSATALSCLGTAQPAPPKRHPALPPNLLLGTWRGAETSANGSATAAAAAVTSCGSNLPALQPAAAVTTTSATSPAAAAARQEGLLAAAPESWADSGKAPPVAADDVYSFGLLLWSLAEAESWPTEAAGEGSAPSRSPCPAPTWPSGAHPQLRGLYESCVNPVAGQRPTMDRVVSELRQLDDGLRSDRPRSRAAAAAGYQALAAGRARERALAGGWILPGFLV